MAEMRLRSARFIETNLAENSDKLAVIANFIASFHSSFREIVFRFCPIISWRAISDRLFLIRIKSHLCLHLIFEYRVEGTLSHRTLSHGCKIKQRLCGIMELRSSDKPAKPSSGQENETRAWEKAKQLVRIW
jgi:hypothetical protein